MKYIAKHKDQPVSSVVLGGKEFKAEDDLIEVPDDHVEAHKSAALIGLEPAPVKESPKSKKTDPAA